MVAASQRPIICCSVIISSDGFSTSALIWANVARESAIENVEVLSSSGYWLRASLSIPLIYSLAPFDRDNIRAIPTIPIDAAKDIRMVLAFFDHRFESDSMKAVMKDIDGFLCFSGFFLGSSSLTSSGSNGSESSVTCPSLRCTTLVA